MIGKTPHILYAVYSLRFHGTQSLKDKRRIIKGLKDRLRYRFNLSLAEIGGFDQWRTAMLGMTMINTERSEIDKMIESINNVIEETRDAEVVDMHREWL